jgi:predicted dehydrogenase
VFKPEEVHALRARAASKPKQLLQVGLQRRYSAMYQAARQMIEKGLLGEVDYVQAQWHRDPGWKMKKDVPELGNWRLFRKWSGGLVAELASHQIDVADWMLGMTPEAVLGGGWSGPAFRPARTGPAWAASAPRWARSSAALRAVLRSPSATTSTSPSACGSASPFRRPRWKTPRTRRRKK